MTQARIKKASNFARPLTHDWAGISGLGPMRGSAGRN
jgi:hypothetical protein